MDLEGAPKQSAQVAWAGDLAATKHSKLEQCFSHCNQCVLQEKVCRIGKRLSLRGRWCSRKARNVAKEGIAEVETYEEDRGLEWQCARNETHRVDKNSERWRHKLE